MLRERKKWRDGRLARKKNRKAKEEEDEDDEEDTKGGETEKGED